MLATIGYQGTVQPKLIAALREAGISRLIDIRAVPQSRKAGFSKRVLAASLAEAGIEYTHLRALGTPKPGRDAVRHGNVALMHEIFAAHMRTPEAQFALAEARALVAAEPCCLLCFERDWRECHREIVANLLGGPVVHLVPDAV